MKTSHLQIMSADGMFYDGKMMHLIVPATDGSMGILPGHEEMIIALSEGILQYQDGEERWFKVAIGRGALQYANNRCTVLVDTAERPEDIDVNRAMEAKRRAEERLREKLSAREYRNMQAALARALTRLKLKSSDNI